MSLASTKPILSRAAHLRARALYFLVLIATVVFSACVTGCHSPIINRNTAGEPFPLVHGQTLDGQSVKLPETYLGRPTIYMVGYLQATQFDIDRWTIGLTQLKCGIRAIEVPTLPGLLPTQVSGWIDDGMRSGIPKEDWPAVVTVYGNQAKKIAALTGTQGPRNARVLLIDSEGVVRWSWDQGFSAKRLIELIALGNQLANQESQIKQSEERQ
jgi:hypothetical protein